MRNNLWALQLISTLLILFPAITLAQRDQQGRILMVDGYTGKAAVVEIGGHAYVEIEGLAQVTHGSLSFKENRIVLTLPTTMPPSAMQSPELASSPSAQVLSRDFMRAGIEEIATMREWASTVAYAIENGYQVTENWAANYRERTAHDLRLASAAVSTDADRDALQLLTNEFEFVREWSNKLIQERKAMDTAKYALSANALRDDPMSQKITTCGHFLASMLAAGSFQDDPSCH